MAPSSSHKNSKRHITAPALIASLTRVNLPAGPLTLDVRLSRTAKLTRPLAKRIDASVTITITPPSGRPEIVIDTLAI